MKITASYKSDVGTFRKINQDAYLFLENKTGQVLSAVCDGLGGHKCGEIASAMAVKILKKFFLNTNWTNLNNDQKVHDWLKKVITEIQTSMDEYSTLHEEANDMGTTMVIALITNSKAYFVNIGDSRIYLFFNDKLIQLTKDHNILNLYLQDKGIIENNQELDNTYWKALTSALGPIKNLKADIFNQEIRLPCYLLLTSDGVHDFLDEWEISHILEKKTSAKQKVKSLIKTAIDNISTDNLTAILIEINK